MLLSARVSLRISFNRSLSPFSLTFTTASTRRSRLRSHHVGATKEEIVPTCIAEVEDPGMLEEPSKDAANSDVVTEIRYSQA